MAISSLIEMFIASAQTIELNITDANDPTVAIDVSGASLSFMVKRSNADLDANAVLTITTSTSPAITVTGAFNASAAANLQRVRVPVTKANTVNQAPGIIEWELKRTDAGQELPYARGPLVFYRGTHRS